MSEYEELMELLSRLLKSEQATIIEDGKPVESVWTFTPPPSPLPTHFGKSPLVAVFSEWELDKVLRGEAERS